MKFVGWFVVCESSFCGAAEITLGAHRFQRALGKRLIEKK